MKIKIKNFKLITNIGIYDWEQKFDREINLNIEMSFDKSKAILSDDIKDTIDYQQIYLNIKNLVAQKQFKLIETLANEIAELIMLDNRIDQCKIELDKLKIFPEVESCSVELVKQRDN